MSKSNRVDVKNIIILGILLSIIVLLGIWSFTEQKAESYQIQKMEDKGKVPSRLDAPVELKQLEQKEEDSKEDASVEIEEKVDPSVKAVIDAYISKLITQLGVTKESDGTTIYGEWWASKMADNTLATLPWSTMFLAWGAAQVGIAQETIGYFGTCDNMKDYYVGKEWYYTTKAYKPAIGDIVYVDTDANDIVDRVGVVESVTEKDVAVIMGDIDDTVRRKVYDRSDKTIKGFGKPDYVNNEKNINKQNEQIQMASVADNTTYNSVYNDIDNSTYNSSYSMTSSSTYNDSYGGTDVTDIRTGSGSDITNEQNRNGFSSGSYKTEDDGISAIDRLLKIAEAEVGYTEESDGWSKYGQWYEEQVVYSTGYAKNNWSAMFISWCIYRARISRDVINIFATPNEGVKEAKKLGIWHDRDSYIPKKGDIIFFVDGSHCGLVIDYDISNEIIYTIEGNTNRKVNKMCHEKVEFSIEGYASPNYQ